MIYRLMVAIFVFTLAGTALASSVDEAHALFNKGEYDAAIDMAIATEKPEGLVMAAETLSAKVMLHYVDDAKDSAKQARQWAEVAFEQMPGSQEAAVQFALAYGFETRSSSPFRAWRKNLPAKTLKAIQFVRENYPDDPRGDALLGAWHLGIVRKTGAEKGAKWFDASEDAGVRYYESAMGAAPRDIVIACNYVVTILALDIDKYYDRGLAVLEKLGTMKARNAVEREVLARMDDLFALKGDKSALSAAVIKMVDGETSTDDGEDN